MGNAVRLHLGAGERYWPGYTNYDVETDHAALPHDAGSVDEIHAIHLVEHIPRGEVDKYLQHWRDLLKPSGMMFLEMPCLDKVARLVLEGHTQPELIQQAFYGALDQQDNPLMQHRWTWTIAEITTVLARLGFSVAVTDPVYHVKIRDMRVIARKL